MNTEDFKDPENIDEIVNQIKEMKELKDVYNLCWKTYPKWIHSILEGYSEDYPHFTENWKIISKNIKNKNEVKMQRLIIVNYLPLSGVIGYKLISIFCEIFVSSGFMVRDINQIFPCSVCNKGLPTEHVYNLMKDEGMSDIIPEKWSNQCMKCNNV